ncbi:MAG: hypothetical protein M3347_10470 [Armatimonadota bacterium]|nr:hypothetical protein [Armatimonadota bacterium]
MKRFIMMLVVLGSLASCTVAKPTRTASVKTALAKFNLAVQKKDTKTMSSLFSKSKGVRFFNTIDGVNKATPSGTATYAEIAQDFNRRKWGLYYTLFIAHSSVADKEDPYFSFAESIRKGKTVRWKQITPLKFVLPSDGVYGAAYLKWKKEAGRWVIEEIGYPES